MENLDKKYYKIREVAEILGLPASTLRFWESEFPQLRPRRTTHSTRQYTPEDVEKLRMIKYLVKDRGLKLDAARDEMRKNPEGVSRRYEAVRRIEGIRDRLSALLKTLDDRLLAQHRAARVAKVHNPEPPTLF